MMHGQKNIKILRTMSLLLLLVMFLLLVLLLN